MDLTSLILLQGPGGSMSSEVGLPNNSYKPIAGRVHPFCNLQSRARTHVVLVIGLYELLGSPTTELIEPPGP
jgi:hypothetical protein